MFLSSLILSLYFITIFPYNANCQLDLDTNSTGADSSLTYVYIYPDSATQLFPSVSLFISNFEQDTTGVTISTESGLTNEPCFTQSNNPPCAVRVDESNLNTDTAISLLQSIYYVNSNAEEGRVVVLTVTVRYQVGDRIFESYTQYANVTETRDKPIISFRDEYTYTPVYDHDLRPTQFLNGDNFTITSEGELYTSLLVCVFTQSELECVSVDTDHPLVDSPISINELDRVCSKINFSPINSTTLLQVFPAFTYSESIDMIENYSDRIISISVEAGSNIGDPLYFNISYHITIDPTPVQIQTLPVVHYEAVSHFYLPEFSSVRMSDVIDISRQSLTDMNPITSLLLQSNSSHIPKVSLWNDQLCSSSRLAHPVHKFEICTDEDFFFDLELTSNLVPRFNPRIETIIVDDRELIIYNATELRMYATLLLVGSTTQNPDANHFSLWFKNAPGELRGCPLEVSNGAQVNYRICLSGSDSTIIFLYSGLAPNHSHVRVTYPTQGAFRLDDWNYVSVSVTRDSIDFLLNELELNPSEFYWLDETTTVNYTQIPIHLYSSSRAEFTIVSILGKDNGFIGEVTGVIVDQFFISVEEAYCMFSCIEGFYMNETILNTLQERGFQIRFVKESFEIVGNMSISDISYILQNLYYDTPLNSSNTYRLISVTASDDLFVSTEVTRISYECDPNPCSNNSYCYSTDTAAFCLCVEGYLDASANADMTLCKHPMNCSYLNGGCNEVETCVQKGEEVRECVDACGSIPCLNGGTCGIISVSEYECACAGEFYGIDCECRNSCLVQDCSPGSCVDFCDGSYMCVSPPSSSTPVPTSSLLSTASRVVTSPSFSLRPTSSLLRTSRLVSSLPLSSSVISESTAPVTSIIMTSSTVDISSSASSSYIPSSSVGMMTSSGGVVSTSSQVASSSVSDFVSSSQLPTSSISSQDIASSSSLSVVTSVMPTSSQIPSSSVSEFITSSQIPSSSVSEIITSSQIPSSSVSEFITSSQIPSSSVSEIITSSQMPSSSVSDIITSSQVPSSVVSEIITSSQIPSSSVSEFITSSQIPSSSASEVITSSQVPSSSFIASSQIPSSSASDILTSSRIPSSYVSSEVATSSQVPSSSIITSSQVPSSSVITSSQIPSSFASDILTSSRIPSSSISEVITSSQVPSSTISEVISSSQVPSSSVSEVITSSQAPSSSISEVITSSQIPSSSVSEVITSSQIPSSSVSEVITSSQAPSSSISEVITSSQVPSSTISEVISSSQAPSSSVSEVITSSQTPSSSISDVITSSQVPSSSVSEVITSSQAPSSSISEVITSSQIPSSSVSEVITSSQILQSSSVTGMVTSSEVPSSSVQSVQTSSTMDVVTSSQIPSSSIQMMTSSQTIFTSSVVEPVTSSDVPVSSTSSQFIQSSSSVDILTSSTVVTSSEPIPTSSTVPLVSTDVAESTSIITSSDVIETSSSIQTSDLPESTQSMNPTIIVQSLTSSSSLSSSMPTSFVESSIDVLNTNPVSPDVSSTVVTTPPPTDPPVVSQPINVDVAIGIGVGIFVLILVIIFSIALVIALFLFRASRYQNLDPTKEFDEPRSTSPAQITAVFKNTETSVIN